MLPPSRTLRGWYWKIRYRPGRVIKHFIACDIRREVEIVDVSRIDLDLISVRVRTWNMLYAIKGIEEPAPFGDVRELAIKDLWKWSGRPYGGPVPDDGGFPPSKAAL